MHKYINIWKYISSFLGGALILSFFSIFQKRLLGIQEVSLHPKSFVVPVLFGGFAGLIVAFFYLRLRDSRTQLADYLDNIDNLVPIISIDMRFLYVNKAWRETLQYSPEEVKKITLREILHPEKRAECEDIFARIFNGEKIPEFETIFIAKDGSEVHVRGMSNGSSKSEITQKTRGIFRNITVSRESEEFQRLSAQIFAHTQDGLLITNPRRVILSTNRAFIEISGYSEDELLGQDAKELFLVGSDRDTVFSNITAALETGRHWQGELWSQKKNGSPFPVVASISAVMSRHGEVSHYICLIADISRRKKDELLLKQMALYDPLTKLANRHHFHQLITRLINEKSKEEFALFFLDLDGFKRINDRFGHGKGDQLIEAVARRLSGSLREVDAVARLGGDEFGVLLRKTKDKKDVLKIAESIVKKISAPYKLNQEKIHISVSIGISFYPEFATLDDLLGAADQAMYKAKDDPDQAIYFA